MTGYLPADIIIGAGAVVTALVVIWRASRTLRRRTAAFLHRVGRAIDIISGTPAIIDPDTGEPLKEAVPDIGTRMAAVERKLNGGGLGTQLAALQERVDEHAQEAADKYERLNSRIDRVQTQTAEIATTTSREIQRVTERLDSLDDKVTSRLFTREEQVERLTAIAQELGIDAEPPDPRDL